MEQYNHKTRRYLKYLLFNGSEFLSLSKIPRKIISIKTTAKSDKNGPVAISMGKETINKQAMKFSRLIISI